MRHIVDPITHRYIQRGAGELVARGSATATEALLEIGRRIGGIAAIVSVLREVEQLPRPPRRRRDARP